MSNNPEMEFSVESYNTDPGGRPQQSDVRKVLACSPQAAALKVLNEELHIIGDTTRLRARVTQLGPAGIENVTTLYSKV